MFSHISYYSISSFNFLSLGRQTVLTPTHDVQSDPGALIVSFVPLTSGKHQLSLEIMGQVVNEKDFVVAPSGSQSGQCKKC